MQFIQKISRAGTLSVFRICLLLLPGLVAAVLVIGNAQFIEQTLQKSGVYSHVVPAILDQSVPDNTDPNTQAFLQDAGVRDVIYQSFSPAYIQQSAEKVLDGTFAWLNGDTAAPTFSIDLNQPKTALVSNLTAYATKRASTLPICTIEQLRNFDVNQTILSIPCVPPGFDVAGAANQFGSDVVNSSGLPEEASLTPQNLKANNSGQTVFDTFSTAPDYFTWLVMSPYIVAGIALLSALAFCLLNTSRRVAFKRLGWTLFASGIFWLLGVVIYWFTVAHSTQNLSGITNTALRDSVSTIISDGAAQMNRLAAITGGLYVGLGTVLVLVARKWPIRKELVPTVPTTLESGAAVTESSQDGLVPEKTPENQLNKKEGDTQ